MKSLLASNTVAIEPKIGEQWHWLQPPTSIRRALSNSLPVIFALMIHRIYHIVDNRFVGMLGTDSLLIHNIQFTFVIAGQLIGVAAATSLMIFWNRPETQKSQWSLLRKHVGFTLLVMGSVVGTLIPFVPKILSWYQIPTELLSFGAFYLYVGLGNAFLQALASAFDGLLIAGHKQRFSLFLAIALVVGNIAADSYAISLFDGVNIKTPLLLVGLSTSVLLIGFIVSAFFLGTRLIHREKSVLTREIIPVWGSEILIALVRATSPLLFTFQLAYVVASKGFLNTYQLTMHLAFLACLPLIGAAQIGVRDASSIALRSTSKESLKHWWNDFAYSGLFPTAAILLCLAFLSTDALRFVYEYETPKDHLVFVPLFFIACLLGQMGHVLAIPLRAAKKSVLVTKNFIVADLVIFLGGNALLIHLGISTPKTITVLVFAYCLTYVLLNAFFLSRLKSQEEVQ